MSLSIYIKAFHGVIAIGDFILTGSQLLLKVININKKRNNHFIEGIQYRSINNDMYKNIPPLLHCIHFYSDVFQLLDDTAINEVVETKEVMKISSNDIVDIAFVFKADEVKNILSDCCGRSNVFIIHYKERNNSGIRSRSLIPIDSWQPFHKNNSYPLRIWHGLQTIGKEICTCLWSTYKPVKWSHSIAISNEVWLYFSQSLNIVCETKERKMRRMIISYLPDMSLQPSFQVIKLQLIGIRTQDQLSMLQLSIGALTGIGIKKRMFEVDQVTNKKKRKFLSNGDLVKRIGPLPEEVDEIDMKVNLRGTKKPGIDFIYDSSTSLFKIQIRHTTLNIVAGPHLSLENLFHDSNKEINVTLPAPVTENKVIEGDIGHIFYDTQQKSWYKVKSILNENEIEVISFDFMHDEEFGERIIYNKSKAIKLMNEQENN